MDQELKNLLEENLRVSKETNRMLKSMRTQAWWGVAVKVIIWIALIIIPIYFLLPFMNTYIDVLEGNAQGNPDLQRLIDEYRAIQ